MRDLLWRPTDQLVRFVAVHHPTRGDCLLLCTDYRAGGHLITELSREFGPSPWAISRWIKQADRDEGAGVGDLTTVR